MKYRLTYISPVTRALRRCVALLMLCLVFAAGAKAQNNEEGIDDRLYAIFTKASYKLNTPEGLHLADSMLTLAKRIGDKTGEQLALRLKFDYWCRSDYNDKNNREFEKILTEFQAKCLEVGRSWNYYGASIRKVERMLKASKFQEALMYLKQVQKQAIRDKNHYGIYSTTHALGNIREYRGEHSAALKLYIQAMEYSKEHLSSRSLAFNYLCIADMYGQMGKYSLKLENIEKGLSYNTALINNILKMSKASALFMMNRDSEFMELWNELKKDSTLIIEDPENMRNLSFISLLVEKKWDEAEKMIDEMKGSQDYYKFVEMYSLSRENYEKAFWAMRKRYLAEDSVKGELQGFAMLDAVEQLHLGLAEIDQQNIRIANSKTEQENSLLQLANSKLALDSALTGAMLAKLNADNNKLTLNNENLRAGRLRDSLNTQKTIEREKMTEAQNTQKIYFTIATVIILLLMTAVIYMIHSSLLSKKLKKVNRLLTHNVEELTVATAEAQKADEQKTEFLNSMSHEIRTPLNAIVGFSQMVTDYGDMLGEKEKEDMCEGIDKNSELLKTMITDILDITAIESGDYRMDMQKNAVNDLCHRAIDLTAQRKPEGVEVRLESDVDDSFEIITDHDRTIQVLVNLLTNAYKNTTEGSVTVSVEANKIPGRVQLAVTDTGIGIPADKHEEVFERFKKLDMFKQGVGLGLSMCRVIAKQLSGKVFIDGGYTSGARFVLELKK